MTNDPTNDGAQPFDTLLDAYLSFDTPAVGEVRQGHVVANRGGELLVDIGAKSEGIIPATEYESLTPNQRQVLTVGNEVRVYVVNPEDDRGNIILSYLKVAEDDDWGKAEKHVQSGEVLTSEVTGFNRGGLLVRYGTLRGFVPASQLGFENRVNRGGNTEDQLKSLVGKPIHVKVLEVDRGRGRLILSELEADKLLRDHRRAKRLAELRPGETYEGTVINVTSFGAFVNIGGIEGLVHLSELSWKHVERPADFLKVGDKVRVAVLDINHERERINLSMKQVETDPWQDIYNIYQVGQLVEAIVTQLTQYGAFVQINDDYRFGGLVHISELSDAHVKSPQEVVRKGQTITARIIRIDEAQRQIGLSIKQVFSDKFMDIDLAQGGGPAPA